MLKGNKPNLIRAKFELGSENAVSSFLGALGAAGVTMGFIQADPELRDKVKKELFDQPALDFDLPPLNFDLYDAWEKSANILKVTFKAQEEKLCNGNGNIGVDFVEIDFQSENQFFGLIAAMGHGLLLLRFASTDPELRDWVKKTFYIGCSDVKFNVDWTAYIDILEAVWMPFSNVSSDTGFYNGAVISPDLKKVIKH